MKSRLLKQVVFQLFFGMLMASASFADFTEDEFFKQFDDEPTFYTDSFKMGDKWYADIALGLSMPNGSRARFPALYHYILTNDSLLIVGSNPFEVKMENSYLISASVSRRISSWSSLGLQVSYSFSHRLELGRKELEDHANFIYAVTTNDTLDYNISANMKTIEIAPILRLGPDLMADFSGVRPYVLVGGGVYYVAHNSYLALDGYQYNFFVTEEWYSGATLGGGLTCNIKQAKVSLEGRYQRIFQPDGRLEFFIPTLRVAYAF